MDRTAPPAVVHPVMTPEEFVATFAPGHPDALAALRHLLAAEREACARVAMDNDVDWEVGGAIARAIRARH